MGVPNAKKVANSIVEAITGAPLIPARGAIKTSPTIAGKGKTQSVLHATASASPISFITSSTPGVKKPRKTTIGPASKTSLADLFFTVIQEVSMQIMIMNVVAPLSNTIRKISIGSFPLSKSSLGLILAMKPIAASNF